MRIISLSQDTRKNVLSDLLKRSPNNYGQYESIVNDIIENVKTKKDQALFEYTMRFDKFDLSAENIKVTRDEIDEAYSKMDPKLVEVIRKSAQNIHSFHEKQLRNSWFTSKEDGTILGMKITPIEKAGVYVPGGKAGK